MHIIITRTQEEYKFYVVCVVIYGWSVCRRRRHYIIGRKDRKWSGSRNCSVMEIQYLKTLENWFIDLDILPVDQNNAKLNWPCNSHIKPRLLRNTSQRTHVQLSNSSLKPLTRMWVWTSGSLLYSLHMTGHFVYRIAGIFRGYKFSRMDLYKGFWGF